MYGRYRSSSRRKRDLSQQQITERGTLHQLRPDTFGRQGGAFIVNADNSRSPAGYFRGTAPKVIPDGLELQTEEIRSGYRASDRWILTQRWRDPVHGTVYEFEYFRPDTWGVPQWPTGDYREAGKPLETGGGSGGGSGAEGGSNPNSRKGGDPPPRGDEIAPYVPGESYARDAFQASIRGLRAASVSTRAITATLALPGAAYVSRAVATHINTITHLLAFGVDAALSSVVGPTASHQAAQALQMVAYALGHNIITSTVSGIIMHGPAGVLDKLADALEFLDNLIAKKPALKKFVDNGFRLASRARQLYKHPNVQRVARPIYKHLKRRARSYLRL